MLKITERYSPLGKLIEDPKKYKLENEELFKSLFQPQLPQSPKTENKKEKLKNEI